MSDAGWLRPLGVSEALVSQCYRQSNSLVISYLMRVATKKPLTEQDGTKVFTSLFRKVPTLRLTVQQRGKEAWLRDMQEERIDFQVIPDADVTKVFHTMSRYTFNTEGPFWAARLLPWSPQQIDYANSIQFEADPEDDQFEYINHVVLGYNHAITDGHSCLRILRIVLDLFDAVLSGNDIDDSKQLCSVIDTKHEKLVFEEIEEEFLKDPKLLEVRKQSYADCLVEELFSEAFPLPPAVTAETVSIPYLFDKATTAMFRARCKKEGVTFHTGFCSVIDAALVKLMREASVERDSYKLSSLHAINYRSYYKMEDTIFGCGIGVLDVTCETPKDVLKEFWSYAKQFHKQLKHQQARRSPFEHHVIEKLTGFDPFVLLETSGPRAPLPPMSYYSATNKLDGTNVVGEGGQNIKLKYFDMENSIESFPSFWMSSLMTYKGQLMHTVLYNNRLMSAATAQAVSDAIHQVLRQVVAAE